MQMIMDGKGNLKMIDSSNFSGDFDSAPIKNKTMINKYGKKVAMGSLGLSFSDITSSLSQVAQTGITSLASQAVNYGISSLIPRTDTAAPAAASADAMAQLEIEKQKVLAAQQQAQAAMAQAVAAAQQPQKSFMEEYKIPMMIGGGLLATLIGLKVAKII